MSRYSKIRDEILSGKSDKNISELINIQPQDGKIKPYQVREKCICSHLKKQKSKASSW